MIAFDNDELNSIRNYMEKNEGYARVGERDNGQIGRAYRMEILLYNQLEKKWLLFSICNEEQPNAVSATSLTVEKYYSAELTADQADSWQKGTFEDERKTLVHQERRKELELYGHVSS